jgi:hypothetical protein
MKTSLPRPRLDRDTPPTRAALRETTTQLRDWRLLATMSHSVRELTHAANRIARLSRIR